MQWICTKKAKYTFYCIYKCVASPCLCSSPRFIVGPSELPPGESTGTKVQHSRPGDSPGSRESDMCLASGTFIPPEGAAVYKRFLPSDVWPILEMKHSLCRHQGGCVYTLIKVRLLFTQQTELYHQCTLNKLSYTTNAHSTNTVMPSMHTQQTQLCHQCTLNKHSHAI